MKYSPEVFERAAELVSSRVHTHCCFAIARAELELYDPRWGHLLPSPHGQAFAKMFSRAAWWNRGFLERWEKERVLALLFAAEMARTDDLPA